jgi:pterin-4a-carbinolamine dehydratase
MLPQAPGMFVQVLGRLAMLSAQMDPEDLREVIAAYATISLQTKKIRGLHENDFIMAAKIGRIFARSTSASDGGTALEIRIDA